MSAEEYFQGMGSDEFLWDPCDWTPNSCNDDQVYERRLSNYNKPIKTIDYEELKDKVAAHLSQPITELPSGTKIIKSTQKAILFLLPTNQTMWVPKIGIKQYSPYFKIAARYFISADAPTAQYANPVQLKHVCHRCPYCGERGCACGTPS